MLIAAILAASSPAAATGPAGARAMASVRVLRAERIEIVPVRVQPSDEERVRRSADTDGTLWIEFA